MFVDIDDPKAPLGVEVMLFPYKKGIKKITPEVCMDVLKSTNYKRGIKDMLNCIVALPKEEQAQFKDVVLATFDNREQPDDIVDLGYTLAMANKYDGRLDILANKQHGDVWLTSASANNKWKVLRGFDWNAPTEKLSGNIWLADTRVNLNNCDFSDVTGVHFALGSDVQMVQAKNLPASLDVSMCKCVNMGYCDLSQVSSLKFRDDAEVYLSHAKNLPHDLDVSMCSIVNLSNCDLSTIDSLKFKEGAVAELWWSSSLPKKIDVSSCRKVEFSFVNAEGDGEIIFKNRRQYENSELVITDDWKGDLIFLQENQRLTSQTRTAGGGRE